MTTSSSVSSLSLEKWIFFISAFGDPLLFTYLKLNILPIGYYDGVPGSRHHYGWCRMWPAETIT